MSEEPAKYKVPHGLKAKNLTAEEQIAHKKRVAEMARMMIAKFDTLVATHAALVCNAECISPIDLCLCQQQGADGVTRWWFEKKPQKMLDK